MKILNERHKHSKWSKLKKIVTILAHLKVTRKDLTYQKWEGWKAWMCRLWSLRLMLENQSLDTKNTYGKKIKKKEAGQREKRWEGRKERYLKYMINFLTVTKKTLHQKYRNKVWPCYYWLILGTKWHFFYVFLHVLRNNELGRDTRTEPSKAIEFVKKELMSKEGSWTEQKF